MANHRRYMIGMLIGIFLLIALATIFNVLVDPYAVFGAPPVAGFNDAKPFAGDRGRVGKLHQVLRVGPKGLIVGNSRPEMGLSPEHPCWPAAAQPVYNIGLPGLSVYSQVRYAQHAQARGPAAALVIGVDFLDFLNAGPATSDPRAWPPSHVVLDAEPFAVDPNGEASDNFARARISDYVDAALSLDALGHSLATVVRQGGPAVPTRSAAGFNPAETFYLPIVQSEGVSVLFQQKNEEIAKRLNDAAWTLFPTSEPWSAEFEALQRLLRQSLAAGSETIVFINPYHAEYLLLLEAAGLWPQFELWKRRLAELARAEGVALWDFSSVDGYSGESIDDLPARGAALTWFWEPAHYRSELGDLMLANIWRPHCPPDLADAPDYGVRLDRRIGSDAELDDVFASQRAARDHFKATHPEVGSRIERLFGR